MTCKHPHNVLCVFHRGSERAEPASMLGKTLPTPSCAKGASPLRVKHEDASSSTQQQMLSAPLSHTGNVSVPVSTAAVVAAEVPTPPDVAAVGSIGGAQLGREADEGVDRLGEFASGGEKTLGDAAGDLSNFEEIVSKMTSRTAFHQAMEMLEHYRKAKDGQ